MVDIDYPGRPDVREHQLMANNSAADGMSWPAIFQHLVDAGFDYTDAQAMADRAVKVAPNVRAFRKAHGREASKGIWSGVALLVGLIAVGAVLAFLGV